MAYVDPKEPNWNKKARENNPMLSTPISHSTNIGIDYAHLQPGSIQYVDAGTLSATYTPGTPLYNDTYGFGLAWGSNGWEMIENKRFNKDQQAVFDYLLKISSI